MVEEVRALKREIEQLQDNGGTKTIVQWCVAKRSDERVEASATIITPNWRIEINSVFQKITKRPHSLSHSYTAEVVVCCVSGARPSKQKVTSGNRLEGEGYRLGPVMLTWLALRARRVSITSHR